MEERSLAERMFDGDKAASLLENRLLEAGLDFDRIRWDSYDGSLELDNVANEVRLSEAQQKLIHDSGFGKVYVNHQDKWETHYILGSKGEFKAIEGWRSNSKVG